jgi:hypothetical protein
MPMLHARRKPDDIAGMDLLNRATLALRPTTTGGDNQGLAEGWVCHAVRAPGSKVTLAPDVRAGAFGWNKGSMRTVPVNQSSGPLTDGCEPILLISILTCWLWGEGASTWASRIAGVASAAPVVFRKLRRDRAIMCEFQIMDWSGNHLYCVYSVLAVAALESRGACRNLARKCSQQLKGLTLPR